MSRRNTDAITIHSILDWIEDNLESPLSLEKVSERSGYSKWHLQRMFKKETGRSLTQYITNKRIEAACRLLSESSLPTNAVAMQVGFQSFAYFSKVFREAKGITPITWRKKHQIK